MFHRSFLILQLSSLNYLVHHFQYARFFYDFSGHAVNLKSKGRDVFFIYFISLQVYVFFCRTTANSTCWRMGEYMYFWKGVSESRVETYYSSIMFGCQQKIKTKSCLYSFVTNKNSLTKANYFLAVKTLLVLFRIQCLFQLLSSTSKCISCKDGILYASMYETIEINYF